MTPEEQAAADAIAATNLQATADAAALAAADAAALAAATVAPDLETETLLTDISTLMGTPVSAEQLGNVFAWAKASKEDAHLQDLVRIADAGSNQSHGAIILLINRHTAAAVATPVGKSLSDRVIKQAMSRTAHVPVLQPEAATSNFIANESAAIVAEAKASGHIPSASEMIARLKLEQGAN